MWFENESFCIRLHRHQCYGYNESKVINQSDEHEKMKVTQSDEHEKMKVSQSDEHEPLKANQFNEHKQVEAKHISNKVIEIVSDTENDEEPPRKKEICAEQLIFGEKLSDLDINLAQHLLKAQFPQLQGLRSTLLKIRR